MSESEYQMLRFRRDDDVVSITLDNASRANALSPVLLDELTEVYSTPWLEQGVRAVVLDGEGKNFSAGADLGHLKAIQSAGPDENRADSTKLRGLFEAVLRQEALTVSLVHGACVAGGCGLATAHDFVVASEDAKFLYSEVRIGFVAALVATYLPLRLKGRDIRELLLNPQFVHARQALDIGLINQVTQRDNLQAAGRELVEGILSRSSSQSIAQTKRLLLDVVGRDLAAAFDHAADVNARSRETEDCQRGIAHFLEHKRTPNWR